MVSSFISSLELKPSSQRVEKSAKNMVWAGLFLGKGKIKIGPMILWDNILAFPSPNFNRNWRRQGRIRWYQEKQFAGCTPGLFRRPGSNLEGSVPHPKQFVWAFLLLITPLPSPTGYVQLVFAVHTSFGFQTCCSALWMSMPCPQGTAGLARQSPALPRREMSIRCLRRFWNASAITRTPSYVRADVY